MDITSTNISRVTCTAPVNIAVIKYWGKTDEKLILPLNSSLSVTLHQNELRSRTTVALSKSFERDRIWLNGVEENIQTPRIQRCLYEIRKLACNSSKIFSEEDIQKHLHLHICSENNFPTAAGLASSASGFACLVYAIAQVYGLQNCELSAIARQGSGSACRSMYGGFAEWERGYTNGEGSIAIQVAPDTHWPELEVLILVVSDQKKHVSSTAGMQSSVDTSSLIQFRACEVVPQRIKEMKNAIYKKDFQTFGRLTMQDSNQFHAICLDTYPPIFYLNDTSKYIMQLIQDYNRVEGSIKAAYSFDAGPNAVLFAPKENISELLSIILHYLPTNSTDSNYLRGLSNLSSNKPPSPPKQSVIESIKLSPIHNTIQYIIHTKVGPGPQVVAMETDSTGHLLNENGIPVVTHVSS